jgi:hypothetical protein
MQLAALQAAQNMGGRPAAGNMAGGGMQPNAALMGGMQGARPGMQQV